MSDLPEKLDGSKMADVAYWRREIADIAGPRSHHDTRESWLNRAARRANVSYRQVKALFYGESVDPRDSVARSVRSAAEKARKEAMALAARYEAIAGSLHAKDADFHSPDIAALIDAARALRGLDRSRDSGEAE